MFIACVNKAIVSLSSEDIWGSGVTSFSCVPGGSFVPSGVGISAGVSEVGACVSSTASASVSATAGASPVSVTAACSVPSPGATVSSGKASACIPVSLPSDSFSSSTNATAFLAFSAALFFVSVIAADSSFATAAFADATSFRSARTIATPSPPSSSSLHSPKPLLESSPERPLVETARLHAAAHAFLLAVGVTIVPGASRNPTIAANDSG